MTDDIKIEEHDVLDNPYLRTIFPDLSSIKKEIENYFDDAPVIKEESLSVCSPLDQEHSSINELTSLEIVESNASKIPIQKNKIIIGSKPNKKLDYEEFFKRKVRQDQPKVLLDDLGSYLNRSDRYCRDCFILFPKKLYLENHNKTEHLQINVAKPKRFKRKRLSHDYCFKKIKCNMCGSYFSTKGTLRRHCRNFHNGNQNMKVHRINKIITKVQNDICSNQSLPSDENMSCFHCKLLFPTQKSLIEHLYNVLQSKSTIYKTNSKKSTTTNKKFKKYACPRSTSLKCKNESDKQIKEQLSVANTQHIKTLYYRCDICSYYFADKNICLAHRRNKHEVLNSFEKVKEPYNSKCKYCSIKLKDVSEYNEHLKKNHNQEYTFVIKKAHTLMTESAKMEIPKSNKQSKAQNPSDPIDSQENTSITVPAQHILIEKPNYDPFALKSILFKCYKCDIHFLSAKLAVNHTDHMEMLINWKCSTCQRIFKKEDELLHEKQHLLSNEFDVHELCAPEFTRILYNCQNCAIHFTEDNFLSHYKICGIETSESVYCKHCDILIDCAISIHHESSHQKDNLVPTDFIIIDSEIIPSDNMLKEKESIIQKDTNLKRRNETIVNKHLSKKRKQELGNTFNIMNLTFCTTCKCFISDVYKRKVHLQSRCAHLIKYVCKFCGLVLTAKSFQTHKNLHLKIKNLKLQDFNFFQMGSDEQICPPIPEYFKCKICEVSFISRVASITHECSGEEYLTCHICETKLSEAAFKLHMLFHHYSNTNVKQTPLQALFPILQENPYENYTESVSHNKDNSTKICKTIPPEYSKKNLSTEGFIFFCSNCSVAVGTYEKVIEHCHQHYSSEVKGINTEVCIICNLKFDISCHEYHQMLHFKYDDQDFFRVLKFDTFYFTQENNIWIKHLFDSLSQEQIDKIVGPSIFKFEARIKMEIIQDGPSELTVYKCDKCKNFIDGTLLYRHAENSCFKLRRHPCSYCGLPFISAISRMEHEKIHKGSNNISSKSYRIVAFNQNADQLFNRTLYSCKHFVLYQCRKCDGVVDKLQIPSHECYKYILKKCLLCGLLISGDDHEVHTLRHKELPNFNEDNMKVILFGDKSENDKKGSELVPSFSGSICDYMFYSCTKCQVCVKSLECTLRHRCVFGISKSECPKCELSFTTTKLKHHLKLHDTDPHFVRGNMKLVTFDPPEGTTSAQKPLEEPFLTDSITEKSEENFNNNCKTADLVKNNMNDLRIKDIAGGIEELNQNKKRICDDVRTNAKLYKCTCGLHFLDETTLNNHFKMCNPKIRASKQKCTKCNLLFTPNILFSHLLIHHGNKKHEYNFEIVEMTKR